MCSILRASLVQLPAGQRHGWPCVPWNRLMMVSSYPSWKPAAASNRSSPLSPVSLSQAPIPGRIRQTVAALPAAGAAAAVSAAAAHTPWNTLAVLCSCAAAAQAAEEHTAWGRLLSAPLLTLLLALGAAALGLLPPTSPVYDVIWSHLMPMAVALLLLEHDVSNIRKAGGPVLVSFLLGAGTMVVGAAVSWLLCKSAMAAAAGSTAAAAQLAACLLASYIGGSVNFIAVAAATQLPTHLVPGAMAADNLGMLLLLGLLMAVPLRWYKQQQQQLQVMPLGPITPSIGTNSGSSSKQQPSMLAARPPAAAAAAASGAASGPMGLDGSPLLTQPPSPQEVAACFEATTRGRKHTGATTAAANSSNGSSNGSSRSGGRTPTAAADMSPETSEGPGAAAAASASVGKCGGCRGSGVTAHDEHPLLTQAPGMGDAISTITAARQGKPQLQTPPKPPSAGSFTTKPTRTPAGSRSSSNGTAATAAAGSSNGSSSSSDGGYSSNKGPDGLIVGCGGCSEALDDIAAASPPPASLNSSSSGSSGGGSSSVPGGALALDGSPLLTEEPDTDRLAAAVAAARSRGSSGSSVAVSPLSSGEFELLVTLDKDTLLQRLREQQQKQEKQQQRQQQQSLKKAARIVAVDASSSSSSSSSSDSSMDEREEHKPAAAPASAAAAAVINSSSSNSSGLTASSAAAAVAAAAAACAAAHQLATWLNSPALHQLLLGGIAVTISAAASALSKQPETSPSASSASSSAAAAAARSPFAGASQLGQVLVGVFFAALGASCCCPLTTLSCCLPLLAFVTCMTATHWALLAALGGRLLRLPGNVLLCGSAAAIGGPATAAGLAGARGWGELVQPSLLCGSLGYAVGTGAGLLLAQALGVMP